MTNVVYCRCSVRLTKSEQIPYFRNPEGARDAVMKILQGMPIAITYARV
jgi:hypothetical protein